VNQDHLDHQAVEVVVVVLVR
jgi:hypothetical protein